jgi:succinyl-diaminopimelate desuccinylase
VVADDLTAPASGKADELKKAEALVSWLVARGISRIERYDAPDPRVSGGKRPNIVATIPGADDEGRLWIMSHLDVVPPGDLSAWQTDPFVAAVEDGKIYGRGVEDNHQGLVSSVFAALALVENGIIPQRTVKLLFVADEENGSTMGIKYLLKSFSLFEKDDLIFIPDGGSPTGVDIEVAEKNMCWLKVTTQGKQTHGATPDDGANAFLAACDLALRVQKLETTAFTARDPLFHPDRTTLSPTKKEANVPNVNTIPGEDVFYFDMRILPQYSVDRVLNEVDSVRCEVEKTHRVKVSFEIIQKVESKPTASDVAAVQELSTAIREVYGVAARPVGIGGGTVAAYLRNAGHPCVVWSRVNETAHQPNENATIANIMGDAKVFAALMLKR